MTRSPSSFLKARPSRILGHLRTLSETWPDGQSSTSWQAWHGEAERTLKRFIFDLTQPEGFYRLKSAWSDEEHVFPANKFLELESALRALVNKQYNSVQEVWIKMYGSMPNMRFCSFVTVLGEVHKLKEIFAHPDANMLLARQIVVEKGWDRLHSFLVEQLQAAWEKCPVDVERQFEILNAVEAFGLICVSNRSMTSESSLNQSVTFRAKGQIGREFLHLMQTVQGHDRPIGLPHLEILKSLDQVNTALFEVGSPGERGEEQYTNFLQTTGWEGFHSHLSEALMKTKEQALLKMHQSQVEHKQQVLLEMLRGLLKDLIQLEYDIVERNLVPGQVWIRLKDDWNKGVRAMLPNGVDASRVAKSDLPALKAQ
ncbi:uncharacterized protein JCM15063_000738 [Sporobolomyces koalae]|uniref:uncharacterized protein n=1 Tax=Sporobolomyces koalae TaxID=500713 RepID=UPI00317477BA